MGGVNLSMAQPRVQTRDRVAFRCDEHCQPLGTDVVRRLPNDSDGITPIVTD